MLDWQRAWPQGSFQKAVPIPSAAPGDTPLVCLAVNAEWMQYLIGAAKQLMLPSTWGDQADPAVQAAQRAANDLIGILAEATACGVDDMAGIYASECLSADLAIPSGALTSILSLTVQPGNYLIHGRASLIYAPAALHYGLYLYQGDTPIAESQETTQASGYYTGMSVSQYVTITEETTFTLRTATNGAAPTAIADNAYVASGADVATCIEAVPLGVSGPPGPPGPPGSPPSFQFTADCGMQYSTDGGTTWIPVPGWLTYAPGCFAGFHGAGIPIDEIDPGAPPNTQDVSAEQNACNIAAYLAQTVIRGAVNEAQRQAALTNTALQFGIALVALIPGIDIAMVGLAEGASALYELVDGANLADFTAAAGDDALWAAVTCAIYGVIKEDGQVTAANFGAVEAAIGAVSYAHAEVITAITLYWAGLGVTAIRAAQAAGALEVADCSACATSGAWCTWWQAGERDMCNGDWVAQPPPSGGATAACGGSAFTGTLSPGGGSYYTVVQTILPHPRTITAVRVDYDAFGHDDDVHTRMYDAAGGLLFDTTVRNWVSSDGPGPISGVSRIVLTAGMGGPTFFHLTSIKVGGPDLGSPWLESNGVCD